MALSWDCEDVPRLVAQLSPPTSPQDAERVLQRIYRGFARELYREQHESQSAKKAKRELEVLRRALAGLSPRAETTLCDALDDMLFLPFPYDQARAVINPCRDGVPATRLSGAVRLRALRLAIDRAIEDMPRRRAGHPGKVSDATRKAIRVLCLAYCRVHAVDYPTWDFLLEEVRNPEPLDFAFACLRVWYTPAVDNLEPEDVARSLHNYSGRNPTQ